MTTPNAKAPNAKASSKGRIRFPDIPERTPDDMTSAKAIHLNGNSHYLKIHLSDRPNTVVDAEHYISRTHTRDMTGIVYPDLLIAFNADQEALERSNAYVISEQGKPPDFILEVASRSSRTFDRTTKRATYAALGIPEYWRFDESPTRSNPGLAGDRLAQGEYQPINIDILPDGRLRGYSAVLDLILEWREGLLNWIDPQTESPISTLEQEREERLAEREGRLAEREGRLEEREARLAAEARNRELESEIRRLRGE